MFKIGLANDASVTVRATTVVACGKAVQTQYTRAAIGEVKGGRAADSPRSQDNDIVGGHRTRNSMDP